MIRRPTRSTRTDTSFPTRRSSDLPGLLTMETAMTTVNPVHSLPAAIHTPSAPYLTNDEAGAYLRLSPRTLEKMRSEEHTSELQSLMRISYAVFCLKKKTSHNYNSYTGRTQTSV